MQTTCPECRTTFRVGQEQLGQRRGLVRCGKCNAVFNAYDTLLAELAEPPAPAPGAAPDVLSAKPVRSGGRSDSRQPRPPGASRIPDLSTAGVPVLSGEANQAAASGVGAFPVMTDTAGTGEAAVGEAPAPLAERSAQAPIGDATERKTRHEPPAPSPPESPEAILLSELPHRRPPGPGDPPWRRLLYLLGAILLLVLLLLQTAYFLRGELAAALPAARPALHVLCRPLGCRVPLPRQLGAQAIAASHLEHDPEQKSRVRLTLLLANRTGQAQAWPVVSLTLTDVREAPAARKLFPPEVYLPRGMDARAGMADRQEQEIRLDLDIGNLAATGYALNLVYP